MTTASREGLFSPFDDPLRFAAAVTAFLREPGPPVGQVPVWTGPRTDLLAGIGLAGEVYEGLRRPRPCVHGHILGEVPDAVRLLAAPLAEHWHPADGGAQCPSPAPSPGPVLLVGTYAGLSSDRVRAILESAYLEGQDVHLLTGRDAHSLSWVVAKQYVRPPADAPAGLFTDNDSGPALPLPFPGGTWSGPAEIARDDVQDLVLSGRWGRLLFNGHGRDDNLNLGQFTLCGRSPAVEPRPGALGPQCAYGLGCYKPEDKLIPAHRIPAAEIVLNTCLSGPLSDLALYDPAYQILLNALDGPAQTVVAGLTTNNGDRPENIAWLLRPGSDRSVARRLNESAADINPYPAFLQVGLGSTAAPATGPAPDAEPAAAADTGPAPDAEPATAADTGLWTLLGGRASALLHSGLLPDTHRLRERLDLVHTALLRDTQRGSARPGASREEGLRRLATQVAALDLALAQQIAQDPDDPLMDFPIHFGERSTAHVVAPSGGDDARCGCARSVWRYRRVGRLPVIPETFQSTCLRCGDVDNRFAGAPALRVESDDRVVLGGVLTVAVEVTADQDAIVNVGLIVPTWAKATVGPPLRRLRVAAGEPKRTTFAITIAPDAEPQAYYHQAFAVHQLGISVTRFHFGVVPSISDFTSTIDPEVCLVAE